MYFKIYFLIVYFCQCYDVGMIDVLTPSQSNLREPEQSFFDKQNSKYQFALIVRNQPENAKCKYYFSRNDDRLKQPRTSHWMNTSYGKKIAKRVENAYHESVNGALVVALLPAQTDTSCSLLSSTNKAVWQHYLAKRGCGLLV